MNALQAFFLLIFLAAETLLQAVVTAEQEALLRQAEVFFEAKMYDKAVRRYEILIAEQLKPWQALNLEYDIGCAYLEGKNWDKAIEQFKSIPLGSGSSPLLRERLYTNLALAYYHEGLSNLKGKNADDSAAVASFKMSLEAVEEAESARCELKRIGGAADCAPPPDWDRFTVMVKRLAAGALSQLGHWQIAHTSLREGIPQIYEELANVQSAIGFLQNESLEGKLKSRYAALFADEQKKWLVLLSALKRPLERDAADKDVQKESSMLIAEAEKSFQEMIRSLEEIRLAETLSALKSLREHLEELMVRIFHQDRMEISLHGIILSFDKGLKEKGLATSLYDRLLDDFNRVRSLSAADHDPQQEHRYVYAKELLDKSSQDLHQAWRFFAASKTLQGRFMLVEGRAWVKAALASFAKPLPEQLLLELIQMQADSVELSRLAHQIGGSASAGDFDNRVLQAQKRVLDKASVFFKTVYKDQESKFSGNEAEGCQARPWDQVLPDFEQGYQEASRAAVLLTLEQTSDEGILTMQSNAVEHWKKALEELRHPSFAGGACKVPPEQANTSQKPSSAEQHPEPLRLSQDHALRLLQEMFNEDKPLEVAPKPAPVPQIPKPW